jgi:hypothetical protein
MIASYLHNFIFIKTKKTGGTTIEMALAPGCGPDDIVTPIGKSDELRRGNGRPLFQNFSSAPELEEKLRQAIAIADNGARAEVNERIAPHIKFTNHLDACRIKQRLAPHFWERAHKFTIERHPYEKAISLEYFLYKPRIAKFKSFEKHVDEVVQRGSYTGLRYYTIDGQVVVDEFLRCETLEKDLRRLAENLRVPLQDGMIVSKNQTRKDRRPARDILTDSQKKIIRTRCEGEFELFAHEP